MIKIEEVKGEYMTCQSCCSRDNLVNILIGLNERQTSTIRLCEKCRRELIEKIKK